MSFLHKIAVGMKRMFASPMKLTKKEKLYGDDAELYFESELRKRLPDSHYKTNIPIKTESGRSEIDCLLEYDGKLYIIEVKHWKGILTESGSVFLLKRSEDASDLSACTMKSPFTQVKRQASLIKELTGSSAWINTMVYFCEADKVDVISDNVWFNDLDSLASYIKTEGRKSPLSEIQKCFNSVKSTDYLCSSGFFGIRSLRAAIDPASLVILCDDGSKISKKEMKRMDVIHHFTHDDLKITLKDDTIKTASVENLRIPVVTPDGNLVYSLSKIDTILIGNMTEV